MDRPWTPGPWRSAHSTPQFRGRGLNDGIPYECIITGSNDRGGSVLPILGRTHNWPDNFQANARLIAAAPDLFDALEDMRRWAAPGMNWTDETGRLLLANADAALAKALGETAPMATADPVGLPPDEGDQT